MTTTTYYGATCTTIAGFEVTGTTSGKVKGGLSPTEEEIREAGFEVTAYIKGFFRPTAAAVRLLNELGITNPAHYSKANDGLWGSVTVPAGVFKHTPGNPGTPGKLEIL